MQAGQYDRKVRLKTLSTAGDSFGGEVPTYTPIVPDVWANVQYGTGRKFFNAAKINAEVEVVFTIRYRTDIDQTSIVEWNGLEFVIISITEEGRRAGLVITGKAVAT